MTFFLSPGYLRGLYGANVPENSVVLMMNIFFAWTNGKQGYEVFALVGDGGCTQERICGNFGERNGRQESERTEKVERERGRGKTRCKTAVERDDLLRNKAMCSKTRARDRRGYTHCTLKKKRVKKLYERSR